MAQCYVCQKPKATLSCGICVEDICKYCAQFIEENAFSFRSVVAPDISHTTYCGPCFDSKVAPEVEIYDKQIQRAKVLPLYMKDQGKETRRFKRKELPVSISHCSDHRETMLRLAFKSVEANFNAMVDVEIITEKVRKGAYQTQIFSGTGVPINIE